MSDKPVCYQNLWCLPSFSPAKSQEKQYSKINKNVKTNQKRPPPKKKPLQTPAAYTCCKDRCKYNLLERFRSPENLSPQHKKGRKSCRRSKPIECLLKTETFILPFASAIKAKWSSIVFEAGCLQCLATLVIRYSTTWACIWLHAWRGGDCLARVWLRSSSSWRGSTKIQSWQCSDY